MSSLPPADMGHRRRRTAFRSLGIASAAAFAGGVAVVGVQFGVNLVSAGYPPIVHALLCEAEGEQAGSNFALAGEGGAMLPVVEFPSGASIACRFDAPRADYATWSLLGPVGGIRSGPVDTMLGCQSTEDFSRQDPASLRVSSCLRMRAERPGLYLLSVTVMLRGQQSVDRARVAIRVAPPPADPPQGEAPRQERLIITLRLPAMEAEQTHTADLSASFAEHGLMPQSRDFERVVHRLAPGETFVSSSFRVRSATNASTVRLSYVPQTRAVTARFTLRSGSLIDRWSGWVSGTVAIQVRQQAPARDVELPEVNFAVPGRVELPIPEGMDATRARILLRRPETSHVIETIPGSAARLDRASITPRIEGGMVVLEAAAE